MLSALIIVFREVLEAGLIVGVTMAATAGMPRRGIWITGGVAAGVLGAGIVALSIERLSGAFDGVGQDVFNAGVLAIALTYGGMLGKVYAEILESGEAHATQTLMRNGSGRLQAFVYALLPSHAAELASYTVYRWECAIRSSVVLGFVGAGGLGQQLDNSMKMFNGGEVATLLLVFIALVALADRVSAWLRKALA